MKKTLFPLALATVLVVTACSDNDDVQEIIDKPGAEKEMISFSMTDAAGSLSSARTRAGFDAATRIVMRMRSQEKSQPTHLRYTRTIAQANAHATDVEYSEVSFDGDNVRYWDDAYGRKGIVSVFALAIPNKNDGTLLPETKLTGGTESTFINGTKWFTESPEKETVEWSVEYAQQTLEKIANQDLTYSNNIQPVHSPAGTHDGYDGVYTYNFSTKTYFQLDDDIDNIKDLGDGALMFQLENEEEPTGVGKFNKGHLIFNHALTRMTIHIKKGTGVTVDNAFAFKTDTDIKLISVPYSGTFDIETGKWKDGTTSANISRLASMTPDAGDAYKFLAQFVPGYKFREGKNTAAYNVMEFTIDDNTYYITQDMIYKSLTRNADDTADINTEEKEHDDDGNYVEMKQGKNYNLTITVNKKQIETITATLVDWVPVTGSNMEGSNSYVELSLMDATSTACDHFDLYRVDAGFGEIYTDQNGVTLPTLTNWEGDYTDKATLTHKGSGIWSTNWYWESNKAFYHLRTVDKEMIIQGTTNDTKDYINIYSGPINNTWATTKNSVAVNDLNFNDYHWGAPMKAAVSPATDNLTYKQSNGYADYIHPAIGSTKDQINMIEQHMMANIHIVLHTGKKAGGTSVEGGKITLKDASDKATLVTLTNFVGSGKVEVGNGLVTANGSVISSDIPVPGVTAEYDLSNNTLTTITGATDADYYTTMSSTEDVTKSYDYRVVPQPLYHGTGSAATDTDLSNFIGLTLVSPDNNQYYMVKKLYEVTASTVTTNHGKTEQTQGAAITYWYPGYDYTYHIYLNKKDIEAITCTVVDWVNVVGSNKDITLED